MREILEELERRREAAPPGLLAATARPLDPPHELADHRKFHPHPRSTKIFVFVMFCSFGGTLGVYFWV